MPIKMTFREFLMTGENAHEKNDFILCKIFMGKNWEATYGDTQVYLYILGL